MPEPAPTCTFDVLAVGGSGLDTVITLDRLPAHDEKVIGRFVGYMPGGPASNFACAASRLGLRVATLAKVGDDEAGRRMVADFERFGVDTSLIQVVPGSPSNFTICLVDPSGEKAVVVVPMLDETVPLDVAREVLPRTQLVFTMPNDPARFRELARVAHECGTEVMVDLEPTVVPESDALRQLLADVDIASFNRDSFVTATGQEPSVAAARRVLDLGPRLVIATKGAAGSLAVTRDEAAEAEAFAVEVVDTTGASDTFNAAFVAAMVAGKSLAERLRYASAAAAIAVTGLGARGRLPDEAEVEGFLSMARGNQSLPRAS
jgi:sugar/nucleoside kinase (ribokinase family)